MRFDSSARFKRTLPALRHGGYAATIVLPGENPAEFGQLHRELIAEIGPNGVLEEDIVATMAALLWRKQNLGTLRIAQLARSRLEDIEMEQFVEVRPATKEESDRHKER